MIWWAASSGSEVGVDKMVADNVLDVAIVTNNLSRLAAFYAEVFGMRNVGESRVDGVLAPGVVIHLKSGPSTLKILQFDAGTSFTSPWVDVAGASGIRYLSLHVDDFADCVERCRNAGAMLLSPVSHADAGLSVAFVRDPDGNILEIAGMDDEARVVS
jgi:catechol 2,3-dioxygenase-like lactoylglutathione lyase family enzyme